MQPLKENKYSAGALLLIMASILAVFTFYNLWKENRITLDVPSYYTYLPAFIIHQDPELNFIDADPDYYEGKIWYYRIENGRKLIKHPMGISVALSPFFIAGHLLAKISNANEDGYSLPYQNSVSIGVFIYLITGLYFLRKLLLIYFDDKITALTLLAVVMGTNLLWYSTFELLMPHAVSFSLICISVYTFIKWIATQKSMYLFYFAVAFGLSLLIRQLAITFILFFLVYGILAKGGIKIFIQFISSNIKNITLAAFITLAIVSLQLFYWRYVTGQWFYDPYVGEHFVFFENKMWQFLFGFRKGLFIYFPLLLFFIIGLIYYFRKDKAIFYSVLTVFVVSVFIFSSWWAWSYGISRGVRPMIDYYPVMAIPLAAGINMFYKRKALRIVLFIIFPLLILLNLFQTWQYKNGLIHFDNMTRAAYFKGFLQTEASLEWYDRLQPYDWERRRKGLLQIDYSKELILNNQNPVYLAANNLLYLSVNPRAQNAVAAYMGAVSEKELFYIERISGDTVLIRGANGLLFSVSNEYDNIITANARSAGNKELFTMEYIYEGNNLIALRSMNGNYLSVRPSFPYTVHANKSVRGLNETFRVYIKE